MKRFSNAIWSFAAIGLLLFGVATTADAQRRTEREVREAVRTLNSQIDDLRYDLDFEIKNNGAEAAMSDAEEGLRNLKEKVETFDQNVTQRRENGDDINEIITEAKDVDAALRLASPNRAIQDNWARVKRSIETLSAKYGVTANWNTRVSNASRNQASTGTARSSISGGLTGTYQLDTARSEKISDILASTGVAGGQRQDLESKLEAPAQLAILLRGNQVMLASSKAAPVTITADGREKTENSNGKAVRMRATLRGQDLTVSSLGGETDYTITFSSADNGRTLKVTRRITTDYLDETIFAESVYSKTDAVAGLGIDNSGDAVSGDDSYSSSDPADSDANYGNVPSVVTARIGEFIVPNGAVIAGVLENEIDTKVSQNNDRFRLTVQTPDEFRGAIIEGYISGVGRSGQVTGRSNVTFNFTKITLRNGKAYDFAGTLQGVKDAQGKDVKVDGEGTAKSDSQTKETAKRGGIGAGIGALIGAIAGGGKGAAIGAIIGGGAGAGSVAIQGREDVKLQKGSVITVTSSSPVRIDQQISEN